MLLLLASLLCAPVVKSINMMDMVDGGEGLQSNLVTVEAVQGEMQDSIDP